MIYLSSKATATDYLSGWICADRKDTLCFGRWSSSILRSICLSEKTEETDADGLQKLVGFSMLKPNGAIIFLSSFGYLHTLDPSFISISKIVLSTIQRGDA